MDSLIGNSKIMIDDSKPIAANVVYTSAKASQNNVCIGTCSMTVAATVARPLDLVPVDDVDGLVQNNTFTCPVAGWWMIWVCWGHIGANTAAADTYTLYYKLNGGTNVLMQTFFTDGHMTQVPLFLKVGDTVSFPVTASNATAFVGSYCFEFIQ